ncbi:hypothetical protein [Salinactinospora qingdaonensis]
MLASTGIAPAPDEPAAPVVSPASGDRPMEFVILVAVFLILVGLLVRRSKHRGHGGDSGGGFGFFDGGDSGGDGGGDGGGGD